MMTAENAAFVAAKLAQPAMVAVQQLCAEMCGEVKTPEEMLRALDKTDVPFPKKNPCDFMAEKILPGALKLNSGQAAETLSYLVAMMVLQHANENQKKYAERKALDSLRKVLDKHLGPKNDGDDSGATGTGPLESDPTNDPDAAI